MDEGKKIIIYTWKYDNGAWGYAVKQKKEGGWLEEESYATKREVEKCYKKYEEGPNGQSVKKKKIDVLVGLPCVEDRYKDKEKENWERSGMEAMCALLDSCGATPDSKREMLRFVASVLAGYCARVSAGYYMQFLSPLQRRAPIIFVKQAPFAGEVLERVVRSLALNTTCQRKRRDEIKCKYTPVLPMKASDEKITDRAFLKLEGRNKRMLPQYRDTTLMVYSWFLRGKDGKRLQLMNRWVSMVIYGASRNQVLTTPVEIEGKDLATSDCQWSVNDVQVSVIRYARYIFRKSNKTEKWGKMIQHEFSRYDKMIDSYNQKSNVKIKAAERYPVSMQLLSLHLFLKACVREQDMEQDKAAKIENEWYSILLPGCEILRTLDFAEQEDLNEENGVKEEFENALVKIIDEGFPDKFIFEENAKSEMWGEINKLPQNEAPEDVFAIRISIKQLVKLLDKFAEKCGGQWLYDYVIGLDLDYIIGPKRMRIKGYKSPINAVAFEINDMEFLSQDLKSKITEKLKCMSDPKERKK